MLSQAEKFEAMRARCKELFALANKLYGVDLYSTSIHFNLRGKVAGQARCEFCAGQKVFSLRFNHEIMAGQHYEDMLRWTAAHETAHLVCYSRPELGKNHDAGWKRVCIALGGNGKSRHSYQLASDWEYITTLGYVVNVPMKIHNRIQAGLVYTARGGQGKLNRTCEFAKAGTGLKQRPDAGKPIRQPVVPPAPRVVIPQNAGDDAVARIVRGWIQIARSRNIEKRSVVFTVQSKLKINQPDAVALVDNLWAEMA